MNSFDHQPIAAAVAECSMQLGDGDLSALGRLFDVSASRLLRYAQTITRSREDAEDALQAAMICVAQNPKRLALAQHSWAYFLRVVRNETLKIVGRRQPMHSLNSALQVWTPEPDQTECNERCDLVRVALKRLPTEQAEVVALKIWEEMTFLEIAIVLGESANTAASRYRYALAKLSRYLQPIADEVCHDF